MSWYLLNLVGRTTGLVPIINTSTPPPKPFLDPVHKYLGVGSDPVIDTKLCLDLSYWLPRISVCKSPTSLSLISLSEEKKTKKEEREPDNVQDLSQLYNSWL